MRSSQRQCSCVLACQSSSQRSSSKLFLAQLDDWRVLAYLLCTGRCKRHVAEHPAAGLHWQPPTGLWLFEVITICSDCAVVDRHCAAHAAQHPRQQMTAGRSAARLSIQQQLLSSSVEVKGWLMQARFLSPDSYAS
jgi:hypothetical protein